MEKKAWELTIGERIELLALNKSANVNAFATKYMGHDSNSSIAGAIRSNNPKYETLDEIISKTGVSAAWLMQGKGEMYQEDAIAEAGLSAKEALGMVNDAIAKVSATHNKSLDTINRLLDKIGIPQNA
jgi:hypothetical protein